ncbi:MAG: restriction endonuclease subunit S [Spirochaetaceae bacterium]|nr:restriction endonuclease subunit S [Spirochaetaceae bacterium]
MAKKVDLPEPIIPNNSWKIVELGKYVKILNGYPFDSGRFTNSSENTFPLIRIRDVVRGYTETFTDEDCPDEYKIKKDEILIGMDGDFNISRWKSDFGLLNQRVCKIKSASKDLDENFLYYYLPIPLKQINDATPSVTVKHLSSNSLQQLHFPLPTLAEQERIVNRIETMFAKLDQAQEKAQTVLDSFETRKAAILHKAFTGQLKIDNEELTIEDWEEKKLGEVCESIFDGDHMPPPKAESGIPFLVISNVNTGFISFDNTRYVPNDYYDSLSETRKPKKGDVLYTIVGSYGIPVLVDSDRAFCFQRHMALLKPSKLISSRYLWYVLQSNEMYQKASSIATGTAQLTVPIKGLRELTIPVSPPNYQLSIVNFLDTVLEKESRAKEAVQTVLDQIALLKKSILARAFRGKI